MPIRFLLALLPTFQADVAVRGTVPCQEQLSTTMITQRPSPSQYLPRLLEISTSFRHSLQFEQHAHGNTAYTGPVPTEWVLGCETVDAAVAVVVTHKMPRTAKGPGDWTEMRRSRFTTVQACLPIQLPEYLRGKIHT